MPLPSPALALSPFEHLSATMQPMIRSRKGSMAFFLAVTSLSFATAAPGLHPRQEPTTGQLPVLLNPTSCPTVEGGAWIVGLAPGNNWTFIKMPPTPGGTPQTYTIKENRSGGFIGGRCLELTSDSIFLACSTFTVTVNFSTGKPEYDDVEPPKNTVYFDVGLLRPATMAVSAWSSPTPAVIVAKMQNNIRMWTIGSPTEKGIATLAELGIGSATIHSMAISYPKGGLSAQANLWIHFTNNSVQQLLRVNLQSPKIPAPVPIVVNAPTTIPLVALSDGSGVALIGANTKGKEGTAVNIFTPDGGQDSKSIAGVLPSASSLYLISPSALSILDPGTRVAQQFLFNNAPAPTTNPGLPTPGVTPPPPEKKSKLPIIMGFLGGLAFIVLVAVVIVVRRKQTGRRSFGKRSRDLFPATNKDETTLPLGIYHQDRSLPDVPGHTEGHPFIGSDHPRRPNDTQAQAKAAHFAGHGSHSARNSRQSLDETIPMEGRLAHHRHDKHTPQGLTHSISVSSTTSNFKRKSAKTGKRFEEKIQLQVIRYEVHDAHLIGPHGPVGRLVLNTFHVVSPAKSARSVKSQGGQTQGIARSGTVLVRRSRLEYGQGRASPVESSTGEDSSMLLTDAENQHTFEMATLKWYMTELHWKREAALLKHLKSPIFVMELLDSYCIPALQSQVNSYPFVNAMGGCSSLLSDLGPVQTARHARSILRSISAAVEWCHRHGVVHLNIQPGSFFLEDDIDPTTEDASWKLWDFTCARFIGEPIGVVGGGGGGSDEPLPNAGGSSSLHPDSTPERFAFLDQRKHEELQDRTGGNPLPAAYTAPELLEAWRSGDTTFSAEAVMDTWSLGCVYYEILMGGRPLFRTEAEAWSLVGGWADQEHWTLKDFKVPYPPVLAGGDPESTAARERSEMLDPSGTISQLLKDMMQPHPEDRLSLETILERIY